MPSLLIEPENVSVEVGADGLIRRQKTFALAQSALTGNTLTGIASGMGNVDSYRDVIFPGAFPSEIISEFLTFGFVADGHDWNKMVAMPTVAEVKNGNLLYTECVFHTTADAQAVRTKCEERLAHRLAVGLSIGFGCCNSSIKSFANGPALLAFAKEQGYDLSLFDVETINACTLPMQAILRIDALYEYSIVPVPANGWSWATGLKSLASLLGFTPKGQLAVMPAPTVPAAAAALQYVKQVTGARDLPLAPRERAWSASAADERVRALTGATDGPTSRYARAFLVRDGDAHLFGSYKLPFADVIDGELHAVPHGIFAAAAVLSGSRGGVELSDADRSGAKAIVAHYYDTMARVFNDDSIKVPWESDDSSGDGSSSEKALAGVGLFYKGAAWGVLQSPALVSLKRSGAVDSQHRKAQYLGPRAEADALFNALYSLNSDFLWNPVFDAVFGWGVMANFTADERMAVLRGAHTEYASVSLTIAEALIALVAGEENADNEADATAGPDPMDCDDYSCAAESADVRAIVATLPKSVQRLAFDARRALWKNFPAGRPEAGAATKAAPPAAPEPVDPATAEKRAKIEALRGKNAARTSELPAS